MGATHFLASDFDFELPPELIAQQPAPERDQARLLVLTAQATTHHVFAELPELLTQTVGAGALLVLNDTRVLPARLRARKLNSPHLRATTGAELGGQVELLLCEPVPAGAGQGAEVAAGAVTPEKIEAPVPQRWRCMYRSSKPLRAGAQLQLELPPGERAVGASRAGRCWCRADPRERRRRLRGRRV